MDCLTDILQSSVLYKFKNRSNIRLFRDASASSFVLRRTVSTRRKSKPRHAPVIGQDPTGLHHQPRELSKDPPRSPSPRSHLVQHNSTPFPADQHITSHRLTSLLQQEPQDGLQSHLQSGFTACVSQTTCLALTLLCPTLRNLS